MRMQLSFFLLFLISFPQLATAQDRPGNGKWWQIKDKTHPKSGSGKEKNNNDGPAIIIENEASSIEQLATDLLIHLKDDWKTCYSTEATLPEDLEQAYTSLKAIADLTDHKTKVHPGTADCSQTTACETNKNSKIGCFTKDEETVKIMNNIKLDKKFGKRKHHQLKSLVDLLEAHKGQ